MSRRTTTTLAALTLAAAGTLLVPATAQASDATYSCQSANLHDFLVNRPVIGFPCTGPLGTQPPGSVFDETTSSLYNCYYLEGSATPDGLYVFGSFCEEA